MRRRAQYDARQKAGLCVACGKRPREAAHLCRCTQCLDIQKRSATRRKNISQSTVNPVETDLDYRATAVTLTSEHETAKRLTDASKVGSTERMRHDSGTEGSTGT
jgi:hypothetical protein